MKRNPDSASLTALVLVLALAAAGTAPRADGETRPAGEAEDILLRVREGKAPTSVAELRAMETHLREVMKRARAATVSFSGGSGVVIDREGHVLTVAHVGSRAGRSVTLTFGDGRRVKAKTLGNDSGLDAGMVKIVEEGDWPTVELGDSKSLRDGAWCFAVGYPVSFTRGAAPPVRIGRVLRRSDSAIMTDCPIMGGDSGGPLFDFDGRVIGISSRCNERLNRNFHVPVEVYRSAWKRFVASEDFNSRALNVAFLGVGPDGDADVAKIGRIVEDSAAAKAGLKIGDVIVEIDGETLADYAALRPLLRKRSPGDMIRLLIRRGAEKLELSATLGRRR